MLVWVVSECMLPMMPKLKSPRFWLRISIGGVAAIPTCRQLCEIACATSALPSSGPCLHCPPAALAGDAWPRPPGRPGTPAATLLPAGRGRMVSRALLYTAQQGFHSQPGAMHAAAAKLCVAAPTMAPIEPSHALACARLRWMLCEPPYSRIYDKNCGG